MERGIRRLAIFQDEMDFEVFLEILKKEAMEKACNRVPKRNYWNRWRKS